MTQSRRIFLQTAGVALAATSSSRLRGADDKVNVAIIGLGVGIAFSEGGSMMRKALWVVLGLAIAFNAVSWGLGFLGFSGGLLV